MDRELPAYESRLVVAFILILSFFYILSPFLLQLTLAAVFALGLEPMVNKISKYSFMNRTRSVSVLLVAFFMIVAVPISIMAIQIRNFTSQRISLDRFSSTLEKLKLVIQTKMQQLPTIFGVDIQQFSHDSFQHGIQKSMNLAVSFSTLVISQLPDFLLSLVIFTLALFSFMIYSPRIRSFFSSFTFLTNDEIDYAVTVMQKSSQANIIASLGTGAVQAFIIATAALILDLGDFWIVFACSFFFAFIPVIGTSPVSLALAVTALVKGESGGAIGMIVSSIIAGTSDNVIRPYFVSSGEDLNPFVSFLAIVGGFIVLGFPGLFIGPMVAALVYKFLPLLIRQSSQILQKDRGTL